MPKAGGVVWSTHPVGICKRQRLGQPIGCEPQDGPPIQDLATHELDGSGTKAGCYSWIWQWKLGTIAKCAACQQPCGHENENDSCRPRRPLQAT